MQFEDGQDRTHRDHNKKTTLDEGHDRGLAIERAAAEGGEVGFTVGRTIGTDEFEFARFDIDLEAVSDDRDALLAGLRLVVKEIADREEAAITGGTHTPTPLDTLVTCKMWRRKLRINYGMTLKGKKRFESHRFDVQVREPLPESEDLEAAVKRFGTWLEAKIKEEVARVKSEGEPSTGL